MKDLFDRYRSQIPEVSDQEQSTYEKYFEILESWNQRMALVSKKTIGLSFANHFVDSLFISDFAKQFYQKGEVYDLGSGAGFPGLVFAIRNPNLPITLYEKLLKKQTFLNAALQGLSIQNVKLEGAMPERPHEGVVLARAVMPPAELFPFLKKRMAANSFLIVNIGSQAPEPEAPEEFQKVGETSYQLPLDCGQRRAICYQFVPRETKTK
jgi:16S rRNA (guanine527-N7)-methyltransferase